MGTADLNDGPDGTHQHTLTVESGFRKDGLLYTRTIMLGTRACPAFCRRARFDSIAVFSTPCKIIGPCTVPRWRPVFVHGRTLTGATPLWAETSRNAVAVAPQHKNKSLTAAHTPLELTAKIEKLLAKSLKYIDRHFEIPPPPPTLALPPPGTTTHASARVQFFKGALSFDFDLDDDVIPAAAPSPAPSVTRELPRTHAEHVDDTTPAATPAPSSTLSTRTHFEGDGGAGTEHDSSSQSTDKLHGDNNNTSDRSPARVDTHGRQAQAIPDAPIRLEAQISQAIETLEELAGSLHDLATCRGVAMLSLHSMHFDVLYEAPVLSIEQLLGVLEGLVQIDPGSQVALADVLLVVCIHLWGKE